MVLGDQYPDSSSSGKIFTLQKKVIKIMAGAQTRMSCRSLFKQLDATCSIPVYNLSNELHEY
jgi:hypothetical protein